MCVRRKPVVLVVLLALLGALGVVVAVNSIGGRIKLPQLGPECIVRADGEVALDLVQMANAATITAVGLRRKMPEQAVVIALATAFQESKLENLDTGDRDSVGLFQQRPSQGWGTPEKIQDPRYAAGKFYSALKKVKGWQQMRVTDAAQKVQRSAYPNAYEKWADESAVLAKALTGRATGAVECTVNGEPALRGATAAAALAEGMRLDWGKGLNTIEATQSGGLTVAVKDVNVGWRYAHWLVSHASGTGVERVRFADREWTALDGKWQPVTGGEGAGNDTVIAEVFS
ncbi:hypothetical protein [Actinoplanes auranticolor]|uniref:Uncharacterized protein n=1 Tax=Actinoplanes auranticolor TaxID=47988 RepID=A0A919SDZ7_9ACTN|nr:hypothetical protein [Actinoplanes auranticolor]GIM70096.1 hypothetical protein Aau02nite_39420 [Actinoplanes auranticolor]